MQPSGCPLPLHNREIHRRRVVEEAVRHFQRLVEVEAAVADLQEQVARLAAAEGAILLFVVRVHEIVDGRKCLGVHLKAHLWPDECKEISERDFLRVWHIDLVRNTPQKRVVAQVLRLKVRGENDELVEGHLHLLAVGHVEEVETLFERHDPAIEQLDRLHALAAEVVNDERAAVALKLDGGFAGLAGRVVLDFEGFHRQLAADDDGGAANLHPAVVDHVGPEDGVFLTGNLLVIRCVEDLHDHAVDDEALGDVDVVAEAAGDALGDAAFAVAGVAVEEHAAAGVDGGSEDVEHFLADQEIGEGLFEVGLFRGKRGDGLGADAFDVLFDGHRGGADVKRFKHESSGAIAAGVSEGVIEIVEVGRAGVDDDLLRLEHAQIVDDRLRGKA